jgi:hypothetical protein
MFLGGKEITLFAPNGTPVINRPKTTTNLYKLELKHTKYSPSTEHSLIARRKVQSWETWH